MGRSKNNYSSLSLFSGAGGLDLGLEATGFSPKLCLELDKDAVATIKRNRRHWKIAAKGDIHSYTPEELLAEAGVRERDLDLIAAGPPCQPFSKSGYWSSGDSKRLDDPRANTLRSCLTIVEAALPRVVVLENVAGLAFTGKDDGLRLIRDEFDRINKKRGTRYETSVLSLNAASYGVPQYRERLFVVACRNGKTLEQPARTHGIGPSLLPYTTAWDAIGDLDRDIWPQELTPTGKWARLLPSIPEGANYLWHTPEGGGEPLFGWRTRYWSFLLKLAKDKPSWTIQAAPGPATGPFHWKSRLLSVQELCRLQTFPDAYVIDGDRRSAHRQIGNAVPCALAEALGREIQRQFFGTELVDTPQLAIQKHAECPPPERRSRVPKTYLTLRGKHKAHPGPGMGPGAIRSKLPSSR
jgi:DNA (cytosine-5)-methyltransferase 1